MKKSVLLTIVFLSIIIGAQFILAVSNSSTNITVETATDDASKVNLAYTCLENKINTETCDKLSLSEKIFAVMATGKCITELMDDSKSNICWPKGGCKVKETAQAMIALKRVGYDTADTQAWLLTQNKSTTELQWFLIIDGIDTMQCHINYGDTSYTVDLKSDKTISSGAGTCLSVDYNNYWLTISPECYDQKFEITCDKSFQTNLIYKKASSSVFYVSEKTNSGPASGTTEEKVYSQCFANGGDCDYEASIWAVYSLVSVSSYDIGSFWPYLQTMAEDNPKVLSDGVLNYISDSATFKANLLKKQQADGYWDTSSGDTLYDTAFALMPFAQDFSEKTKSINWLLTPGVQGKDGCWKNNLLDTAFLLYSIWPRVITPVSGPSTLDCLDSNYFCLSPISCSNAGGATLSGYSCASGNSICCSKNLVSKTCTELTGAVCSANQICQGGASEDASGLLTGESCCVGGTCADQAPTTPCETSGGSCALATYGCASNEQESTASCGQSNQICCVRQTTTPSTPSTLWIWLVLIFLLLVLVVLGLIYRDKLRPYWLQFSSKFSKGGNKPSSGFRGPGLPQSPSSSLPVRTPFTRRLIPQASSQPMQNRPQSQPTMQPRNQQPNEMDDVLKKLKEMSK